MAGRPKSPEDQELIVFPARLRREQIAHLEAKAKTLRAERRKLTTARHVLRELIDADMTQTNESGQDAANNTGTASSIT